MIIWRTEEEMQKELEERISNWKQGCSKDGYVLKGEGKFVYKNVAYLIKILRYFNHTNKFCSMGRRISDCHVVVEYPEETEPIVDIMSGFPDVYEFLYHDTLQSFNDNQTIEEQINCCHEWAKQDIDKIFNGEIADKLQASIDKINNLKNELTEAKQISKERSVIE